MPTPESVMLKIIDTGPAEIKELVFCAPSLVNDELIDERVRPSDTLDILDRLEGQGLIGRTGSRRETIVISKLGHSILDLK